MYKTLAQTSSKYLVNVAVTEASTFVDASGVNVTTGGFAIGQAASVVLVVDLGKTIVDSVTGAIIRKIALARDPNQTAYIRSGSNAATPLAAAVRTAFARV